MKYYVYIARCTDNSLYTGYCSNLVKREKVHNTGLGAKYTRQRLPVKFVYHEVYCTRTEAMQREIQIKKWPKIKKEKLIHTN